MPDVGLSAPDLLEPVLAAALRSTKHSPRSPFAGELQNAAKDALARLLIPGAEVDVKVELKLKADQAAIDVFATNLRELLLAAPLGAKRVLGMAQWRCSTSCAAL